jgi:hypothetical protein
MGNKEEGRRKKEEGRRKKEEGRGKREEGDTKVLRLTAADFGFVT